MIFSFKFLADYFTLSRSFICCALVWIGLGFQLASGSSGEYEVATAHCPPPTGMRRADVYFGRVIENPIGVLVLCPGQNQDGAFFFRQKRWKEFSETHRLVLASIAFASDDVLLQKGGGYFAADEGSGNRLLTAIDERFPGMQIFLYGFSGGAHFVNSFINWCPERVASWCAYSAQWWESPNASKSLPHGIVACGELDGIRLGPSKQFFAQGRAAGFQWTWVSIAGTSHAYSSALDDFVRIYFSALIHPNGSATWRDVDSFEKAIEHQRSAIFSWFPNDSVATFWERIHQP